MKYILKIITVLIMSSTTTIFYSQGFSFLNTVTSSSSGYQASIRAVKVDQLGNKYIAGNFDISATIKNTTITGNSKDIFFGKLDPLGNPVWIKTAGGPGSDQAMDIELDNQGGLYVSGLFSSTANFDGNSVTANPHTSNSASFSDNYLVKYDTSGNFQWIKTGASTRNDNNSNVNGYNNNTQNYYGRNKIKFKNGYVYLMASNRVSSNNPFGGVGQNGRKFDGLSLPYTQAPGGGGFNGYEYTNSFILKTDVNGTNSWLTPIYCNTNQNFDALLGLDFEVNSNNHVIAQYYYSSNGCKIGGPSTPTSISSFSTPSANFPQGALMILELDGSGFYNNVYKLENALSSFNSFFGFGNALNYTSHGVSIDNLDNVYFAFNNYSNSNFNQTIAGINIPENTNTLVKLNLNFVPTNCKLLNAFPSQSQNSFPITALEIKDYQLIFGGTLDGTINLDNNTFSRSDEITFVNMDTNLSSVNWVTSTSNSSVLQVDGSGANNAFPEKYSLGIYDLSIGNENQAVFCGNIGPQYRSFGDYTTTTNQLNDAFITEIIPCNPVFSQVTPANPVICGAGNSATLNANVSPGISYNWINNGNSTSSSNTPLYTTTNVGDFSLITDSLGCKDTSNVVNVTIAPLPNVTVPQSTFTACFTGGPTVVPDGIPSGGVWSGLGMVNDSVFDPTVLGPGPSLITYTYTNAQGCSDDAIRIANTVQTPPLILSNNLPNFCEGDGPYSLVATVNPSGGNYSGPGVSGTTFNPVNAGVGTHLVRYKYSVAQNCEDSVDFYLVVNASPAINYPDYDSLCENISSTPLFSASPFGGTYSGPFVIGNNFYPFFSGAGSFPITYTVTENGCTSSSTKNIQIDANINAQLNNIADFCINDSKIKLNYGIPSGGIYKIDGVVEDSLKPNLLGVGVHTISYEFLNSCGLSLDSTNFSIFSSPSLNAGIDQIVCDGGTVTLSGSGASTYAWDNAVTDDSAFTPTATATYTVTGTDANGCTGTDQVVITVNTLPTVTVNNATICAGDPAATFTATSSTATAWLWSGNGTGTTDTTNGTTAGAYSVVVTDVNGCQSASATGNLTINDLPTVLAGTDQAVCDGVAVTLSGTGATTYSWNNGVNDGTAFTPTTTTTYSVTGTDGNGCIGTDQVVVTVNALPTVSAGADQFICDGNGVTLLATGATTYIWDNGVTNGTSFSPSATASYTVTGTDISGCTATDNLDVTVNASPTVSAGADQAVCDGVVVVLSGSGAIFYVWDNSVNDGTSFTPTTTATYTVIGTDGNGCTAADQVDVTVNALPTVSAGADQAVCDSGAVTLSGSGATTYAWDNGITDGTSFNPTATAIYTVTGSDANSCTGTDSVNVIIIYSSTSTVTVTACDLFTWDGVTYDSTGIYTNNYIGSNGCDSVATLDLTINNSSTSTLNFYRCDTLLWDGITYDSTGIYSNNYTGSNGCDSTVILNLSIFGNDTILQISSCDNYIWNGNNYDSTGLYYDTLSSSCLITLDLTIKNSSYLTIPITACDSFIWDGIIYDSTDVYINNYVGTNGCDSVVTLDLTINNSTSSTISLTECDSFVWDGVNYDSSGTFTNIYLGSNGCDSTVNLDLIINNSSFLTLPVSVCDSFIWDGVTYDSSGIYTNNYIAANGCDSIVTLDLTIYIESISTISVTSCNSFIWDGITYDSTGLFTNIYANVNGCDSVVTLDLTINKSSILTVKVTECDSFVWDGVTYDSTGSYINNYVDANGCDSIVTLDLTINNSSSSTISITECDSFTWGGITYDSSGTYNNIYQSVNGCDSLVTLNLIINNESTSTVLVTTCDSFVWDGVNYDSSGIYTNNYIALNGCDSNVTLDLTIYNVSASIDTSGIDLVASGGVSYLWNTEDTNSMITPDTNGLYSVVALDTNGCADTALFNVTYITSTGIWNNSSSTINLYPNPVNDILNISSSDNIKSLKVKDLLGRIIYSSLDINSKSISLNTSNFRNNVYLLSLIINDKLIIKKIIINH